MEIKGDNGNKKVLEDHIAKMGSNKFYPFSIRKLLTAAGSDACPLLWLPVPVRK